VGYTAGGATMARSIGGNPLTPGTCAGQNTAEAGGWARYRLGIA
jgi:hypothetical protein